MIRQFHRYQQRKRGDAKKPKKGEAYRHHIRIVSPNEDIVSILHATKGWRETFRIV